MGAGALTICHNTTAVQVREDMKKMVQIPIRRPRAVAAEQTKLFGVSLLELREQGLLEGGVPPVVRRMVEHLRKHALQQEGLFRVGGNVRAVETLKQRLESGEEVDLVSQADSCTVASLLKLYLRALPDGLVTPPVQQALIEHYRECGDEGSWRDLRGLLQRLPDVHHCLLRYVCHFLTLVESNRSHNRMTALNLATVFGPSVFHVAPTFEAIKDQSICNKIMVKLIQNYSVLFEGDAAGDTGTPPEEQRRIILVKSRETQLSDADTETSRLDARTWTPVPRMKTENSSGKAKLLKQSTTNPPKATTKKKKVRKGKRDGVTPPTVSTRLPHASSLSIPIVLPLTPGRRSPGLEAMETTPHLSDPSDRGEVDGPGSSQEEDRPISPFYMSNHLSPVHCRPQLVNFLDDTIRSTVEQHLFDVNLPEDPCAGNCASNKRPSSQTTTSTARQRRRQQRRQQEECMRQPDRKRAASLRAVTDKENIPSSGGSSGSVEEETGGGGEPQGGRGARNQRTPKTRKWNHNPTLVRQVDNQADVTLEECVGEGSHMDTSHKEISRKDGVSSASPTLRMKIQESPVACDAGRSGEVRGSDPDCDKPRSDDVPRLDLTALTEDSNWGEPVPAFSLQRESMDREEARLSPHAGGRLIRQLVEEDSDPMVSPRFYAYGHSQQYLDDTEVPPSPPNAHSFIIRRRSSSLGSCDDEKEELTSAQLTKRIHILKKKIHRFEEKFEEERKYRPSHSDKAGNPEVLRWVNELARLRRELKEHKLLKSEEDLPPLTRQRSNTLPKSFGSQLEKKPPQEKLPKPPVEGTLEAILKKLQEKREELQRPEDIKDMTREQIAAEKVALQKALLHYESIHGRPVTKNERQIMKPLYDRYRLVKQILCRASTIPVIEEEDGSEDDADAKTQLTVTVQPDLSVLSFLDHTDEDGFISPVDELSPSKNTTDMRLSNLHAATTQELVEQLQEAREEKKRIRKNLKEFEEQFLRQNGRNVQKEDRTPLAVEYNEYKHIKAKLRLLEVLISKRDSSKFI